MNGNTALKLAREEMNKNGLLHWKVILINSKSAAGRCRYGRWNVDPRKSYGTIELSTPFLDVHGDDEIMDTIRHEIAHALVGPSVQAHGAEWKKKAISIGCSGRRTVSPTAPKIKSRYVGTCPAGHEFARHRSTWQMTAGQYYCPRCHKKKLPSNIEWVDTTTRRVVSSKPAVVQPKQVAPPVTVAAQAPTKLKRPKVVQAPKPPTTWKDRFDQGMTSFGDDW